jgi:hypothetical protein
MVIEQYKFLIEIIGLAVALGTIVYQLGKIHAGIDTLRRQLDDHTEKESETVRQLTVKVDRHEVSLAVLQAGN